VPEAGDLEVLNTAPLERRGVVETVIIIFKNVRFVRKERLEKERGKCENEKKKIVYAAALQLNMQEGFVLTLNKTKILTCAPC
jgi:hypothetical protein